MSEIGRQYNQVAEKVVNSNSHYDFCLDLGQEYAPKAGYILDAGCGNGFLLEKIDRRFPMAEIFGFDPSDVMLAHAKSLVPRARLSVELFPTTKFDAGQFDCVFLSEVLEHLNDPGSALRELYRITRSSGKLILSVPNGDRIGLGKVLKRRVSWQPADDVFYTYSELNLLSRSAGWRLKWSGSIGPHLPVFSGESIVWKFVRKFLQRIMDIFNLEPMRRKTLILVLEKDPYLYQSN